MMGIGTPSIHNKIPRPIKFSPVGNKAGFYLLGINHAEPFAVNNARRSQKVRATLKSASS
jgi:S-ribosylhomocysteine lyase LuxS involved in autoinducer biosynthesis